MRRRALASWRLGVCALVSGCVYYNGVYNANHFAGQAEQSERAGRRLEASDRWRLAQMHAESVIARHPTSHWVADAWLIKGRAQVALSDYGNAIVSLGIAESLLTDGEQRREADLQLGRANLAMHRLDPALAALDSAVLSRDRGRRSRAQLYRGRALMAMHRPVDALVALDESREDQAPAERALAALEMGDVRLTATLAESLAAGGAVAEAQWQPMLDSMSAAGLSDEVGRITAVLLLRGDLGVGLRARLALADAARRMAASDTASALQRLQAARQLVPDSVEGRTAELLLLRLDLDTVTTAAGLMPIREHLEHLAGLGGTPGADAAVLLRLARLADTLGTMPGASDAGWFLRGEVLRDSLGASRLARATFADMPARFPDSPWSPKALLAAIVAGADSSDSLRAELSQRYPDSPYTAIALSRGASDSTYQLLEDSLSDVLDGLRAQLPALAPGGPRGLIRPASVPVRPVTPGRPTTRPTIDP